MIDRAQESARCIDGECKCYACRPGPAGYVTEPFQRTWDDGFAAIICPITPEFCDKHAPSYGEHKCWHRTEARECSGSWESDCECIDACYVCSEGEVLRNKESIVCKRYGQVDEPRHPVDKVPDAAGGEPACPPEFEERSLMDGRSYCFEMCVEGMLESVWKPTCFKVNSSHFWALEQPAEAADSARGSPGRGPRRRGSCRRGRGQGGSGRGRTVRSVAALTNGIFHQRLRMGFSKKR